MYESVNTGLFKSTRVANFNRLMHVTFEFETENSIERIYFDNTGGCKYKLS